MELAILSVELAPPARARRWRRRGRVAPPEPAARVKVLPKPAARHRPKYGGNVQRLLRSGRALGPRTKPLEI